MGKSPEGYSSVSPGIRQGIPRAILGAIPQGMPCIGDLGGTRGIPWEIPRESPREIAREPYPRVGGEIPPL